MRGDQLREDECMPLDVDVWVEDAGGSGVYELEARSDYIALEQRLLCEISSRVIASNEARHRGV